MFKKIAELKGLPGGVTEPDLAEIYGKDPMWAKVKQDRRWLEFLALCILDKKDGTSGAMEYTGEDTQ